MTSAGLPKLRRAVGIALIFGLLSETLYAEISLDYKFPWTESQVGYALAGVGYFEEAINRDQELQGFKRKSFGTLNFFHMQWSDRTYYVAGVQYLSREEAANIKKSVVSKTTSQALPGGGICSLFIYDENLKQAAKHDVKLSEANGRTWCNGAVALARVKGQDALLFSISHYLTDKPVAKRAQDIGDGWRYMTVLLKLRNQDGKVTIEQDDACLGNPNQFKDIASARKALAKCK